MDSRQRSLAHWRRRSGQPSADTALTDALCKQSREKYQIATTNSFCAEGPAV
jgi:hypothetical protein